MPTPATSCFDLTTPRRPTTDDFNGVSKLDDPAYTPNPNVFPSAGEWNFVDWLLLSIGRVMPCAVIGVTGGAPGSINTVMSARSTILVGSLTYTHNGTGDVTVSWPANTFPAPNCPPVACINGASKGMITATSVSNGVQVRTWDGSGAAADLSFTVVVH